MENGKIIDVGLSIDQEYLKASVQQIVKAGIIQALGDPSILVRNALSTTINVLVDEDGKVTRDSYRAKPYLDWLANKVVVDTVRETMTQMVKDQADVLRAEMLRQLSSRTFKENLVKAFLESMVTRAFDSWKMPVTVGFVAPNKD